MSRMGITTALGRSRWRQNIGTPRPPLAGGVPMPRAAASSAGKALPGNAVPAHDPTYSSPWSFAAYTTYSFPTSKRGHGPVLTVTNCEGVPRQPRLTRNTVRTSSSSNRAVASHRSQARPVARLAPVRLNLRCRGSCTSMAWPWKMTSASLGSHTSPQEEAHPNRPHAVAPTNTKSGSTTDRCRRTPPPHELWLIGPSDNQCLEFLGLRADLW